MGKTSIAWTHYTFNPWWGCEKISPGCAHCYAATFDNRLALGHWGADAPRRFFDDRHWNDALRWNRRREAGGDLHLVFCASMADVFEDRRDLWAPRYRLWELIEATPALTWQLVTKRPENINRFVPPEWQDFGWPTNVWAIVTAENQAEADRRIPILLRTGARVKVVSYEPALEAVDFRPWLGCSRCKGEGSVPVRGGGAACPACFEWAKGSPVRGPFIDWLICGGESGPGARPFDVEWARSTVRQCKAAGIPAFYKQGGSSNRCPHDSKGGHFECFPQDLRVREFPRA